MYIFIVSVIHKLCNATQPYMHFVHSDCKQVVNLTGCDQRQTGVGVLPISRFHTIIIIIIGYINAEPCLDRLFLFPPNRSVHEEDEKGSEQTTVNTLNPVKA